jgi:hypothetical protein
MDSTTTTPEVNVTGSSVLARARVLQDRCVQTLAPAPSVIATPTHWLTQVTPSSYGEAAGSGSLP